MFSKDSTRAMRLRVGKLSSWPAPPLLWTGHAGYIKSVSYSPNAARVVTGSDDRTIRIWDAESGTVVGEPLTGHTAGVNAVVYSPDGRHIISGSSDHTIRIWDAEAGATLGSSLEGHTGLVAPIAYSSDRVSGSFSENTCVRNPFPYTPIRSSPCNSTHPRFYAKPDKDGWVRDEEGGLLYWVPQDCREGLHSAAVMTIPLTSRVRSVSLDFDDFAFGTSWTQFFKITPS